MAKKAKLVSQKRKELISELAEIKEKALPKPQYGTRITDELIGKALLANHGLQYLAAEAVGMSGQGVSDRIATSAYLMDIKHQCMEKRLDIAEKGLTELNIEKDLGSICFMLKTQGKKRGYSEQQVVAVDEGTMKQFSSIMAQLSESQEKP